MATCDGGGVQAEYAKCSDGRTRLITGWDQFAIRNNLAPGMDVMMLFYVNMWSNATKIVLHEL